MDLIKTKEFTEKLEKIDEGEFKYEFMLALKNVYSKTQNEIEIKALKNAETMATMAILQNVTGLEQ
ncbi:MAG: hypothetical protein GY804_04020 [Alphaproteobacteria bacterium]|nr:hypothetical protein [Alphaproteobacteria bacterium]